MPIKKEKIGYIAYASDIRAIPALQSNTFLDIQRQSAINNEKAWVSGFLCFKNGKFFQYIEGELLTVMNLYQVIQQDPRHKNIQTLATGELDMPIFHSWAMYCFYFDKNQHETLLSFYFADFDVHHWDETIVQQVVADVKTYYRQYVAKHGATKNFTAKNVINNQSNKPVDTDIETDPASYFEPQAGSYSKMKLQNLLKLSRRPAKPTHPLSAVREDEHIKPF